MHIIKKLNHKSLKYFKMSSDSDSIQNSSKFATRASLIPNEIINQWDNEQKKLQHKIILQDTEEWQKSFNENLDIKQNPGLRFVAGLDLSFIKGNDDTACAGLVILDVLDNLKVIYEDISMVDLTQPYVPGYLAFREAPCLVDKLNKLKTARPEIYPQCLFIDGNGILHPKRFGLACHLGVLTDTPSIGIAKKLFQIDGLENSPEHKMQIKEKLKQNGDYFELRSNNDQNELIGLCYRTAASNPVYVSIGHKVSWKTCLKLLKLITTKYRIPEPTRQADLRTREYLRKEFPSNQDQFKTFTNDNDEND